MSRYIKIPLRILGGIVGLIIIGWLVIKTPYVNKALLNKILSTIAKEVKDFSIEAEGFDIDATGSLELRGCLIKDKDKDTLFYAKKFELTLRKLDLIKSMDTKVKSISFSDAILYLVKDFSSEDTASSSDLMTQIRAYIPMMPEEINIHRLKLKFNQPIGQADISVLSTEVLLTRDTSATNIMELLESISLESPYIAIHRYLQTQEAKPVSTATAQNQQFVLSKLMDTLHKRINNGADFVRAFPQMTSVHIKNLNVMDYTPSNWGEISSMDIDKNKVGKNEKGAVLELSGQINKIECSLDVAQQNNKTNISAQVGESRLLAEYSIKGDSKSPEIVLSILRSNYEKSIFSIISRKSPELSQFFIEHLKLQGEIRSTEKNFFVYVQTENSKELNQVKLIGNYNYASDSLSIDTLSLLLGETNITALNKWLKEKEISMPYELSSLGFVSAKGFMVKDVEYSLDLHIDQIGLTPIDPKLTRLSLSNWNTSVTRLASQRLWWKVKQEVGQIKLNNNTFEHLQLAYEQQGADFAYNSVLLRLMKQNSTSEVIHVEANFSAGKTFQEIKGNMSGKIKELAVNNIYQLDTPFDKLVYSSEWNLDLKKDIDVWSIIGKMKNLHVENLKNKKSFDAPSMSYNLEFASTGDLISVKTESDTYEVWNKKSSIAKVINKLIYHHKYLLKSPDNKPSEISKEDDEFELSFSSKKVTELLNMLGINASVDRLSLNLKVAADECNYFVKAENINYLSGISGDLNLRFIAEKSTVNFILQTDNLNVFKSDSYRITNGLVKINSSDRINFSLDTKIAFQNQKQFEAKARLISTDSVWSELRVDNFFINTITHGIWRLNNVDNKESKFPVSLGDEQQEINLLARYNRSNENIDITASIRHIDLEFLNDLFFIPSFTIKAFTDLQIQVKDKITNPVIEAEGNVDNLHFNNSYLGDFLVTQSLKNKKMKLSLKNKDASDNKYLDFKALIDFSGIGDKFNLDVKAKKIPLLWLNHYTGDILSNVNGLFSGDANIFIDSENDDLFLSGKVMVYDVSFLLLSNNVKYQMDKTNINLNKTSIEIKNWVLHDMILPASSMTGNLKISQQKSFDLIDVDLQAKASRILLFDTTIPSLPKYSSWFRGSGDVSFNKKANNSILKVNAEVTEASNFLLKETVNKGAVEDPNQVFENSKIYFGTKSEFLHKKDTADHSLQEVDDDILTVDCKLALNKKLKVKFFMSEKEDEAIGITGEGNISVLYKSNAPNDINGEYVLTSMTPFQMGYLLMELDKTKRSRLHWEDKDLPNLEIYTVSKIENVDFSSLYNFLGNREDNLNIGVGNSSNMKSDINLLVDVSGVADNPQIDFDIALPSNSSLANSQSYRFFVNKFRSDPEFAKREVGYLVIFNKFMGGNAQNVQLNANAAVAGAMSSLTTYLLDKSIGKGLMQKAINQALPGLNIQLNINSQFTSSANSATSSSTSGDNSIIDKGKINVSLSKSFLSDRITFSIGSAFDYNIGADKSANSSLTKNQFTTSPSADLKWKITEESNLFMGLYYRNSIGQIDQMLGIVQQNPSNIIGINFGVTKEFDSFKELMKKKNKSAEKAKKAELNK